jgi:hypothetical protein
MCILNQAGAIVLHRNMKTEPEEFLKAIAPFRQDFPSMRDTPTGVAISCARALRFSPSTNIIHRKRCKSSTRIP